MKTVIYFMIYLGSALMIYNIIRYFGFTRKMKWMKNGAKNILVLYTPMLLLILFLIGYLLIALIGKPDLLMAGILFGGSVFVFIILGILYYIIEKVQENEKLEHELDKAREASKAKSFFLSNMSHDIRTPMNAIIGYTELAGRNNTTPDQMSEYLGKINRSGKHLLSLINDILEMSQIENGKLTLLPVETDLTETLLDAKELFQGQMDEKGISFTVDYTDVTHPHVLCDENRLSRVLFNLLSNAYKFTEPGGHVEVTLREILFKRGADIETIHENEFSSVPDSASLQESSLPAGKSDDPGSMDHTFDRQTASATESNAPYCMATYRLTVKDDGIGMSKEFAARVFDAFERERTSTASGIQGTGLGMAITKNIVDAMGGDIRVESTPKKGTEFILQMTFPITSGICRGTTMRDIDDTDYSAIDFSGYHLLLVEDNPINRELASHILTDAGFTLEFAENGKEAVDTVAASAPGHFHAILMDIQMPVMNGYDATRQIRHLPDPDLAAIPIIAMTANAFAEDLETEREAGMDAHVSKPLDVNEMMRTLAEQIRQ